MKPLSLRDLRRLVVQQRVFCERGGSRSDCAVTPRKYYALSTGSGSRTTKACLVLVADYEKISAWLCQVDAKTLDKLIALLGPNWTGHDQWDTDPAGGFRPKNTAEVAPSVCADGDLHGGDGNSGEVDAPAETSPEKGRDAPTGAPGEQSPGEQEGKPTNETPKGSADAVPAAAGQDGSNAEPPGPQASARPRGESKPTSAGPTNQEASRSEPVTEPGARSERGEPTDRAGNPAAEVEPAASDDLGRDTLGGDRDAGDHQADESVFSNEEGVPVTSSASPRDSWGGTFDDQEAAYLLRRSQSKPAQEIVRAIRKLIRAVDLGGVDESPRISGSRLVCELKSRRYHLARAVRRELATPLVLLLADVSGSCSAVCTNTLAACLSVAEQLDNAVVLRHSNGWLTDGDETSSIASWVADQNRQVGLVVAFGDWDAGHHYQKLCMSGASLVWLDSYCCNITGVTPASRKLRDQASAWKRQPLAWFQGVNDSKSAAIALRAAAKGAKRG